MDINVKISFISNIETKLGFKFAHIGLEKKKKLDIYL